MSACCVVPTSHWVDTKVNLILKAELHFFVKKKEVCVLLQLLHHFNDACHLEVYVAYSYYLGSYNFTILINIFSYWNNDCKEKIRA